MSKWQRRINLQAVGIGLVATAVVLGVYLAGGLDWLELKTLDWRFRYANSMLVDPRIVCIDIDDDSLEIVGRWPWARDIQAGLIEVMRAAGLRALLYDIELTEPEPVRSIVPRQADIAGDPLELTAADSLTLAYPDQELRLAIADLARVYLAFHYENVPTEQGALPARIRRWLQADAARWQRRPDLLFNGLFEEVVGGVEQHREQALVALRDVLSYEATLGTAFLPSKSVSDAVRPVPALSPVYFPHARAARRCGFVVFEPDSDGVMRRMRLLVSHEGRVIPQLAFALAYDELGLTAEDMTTTPGTLRLRIPGRKGPLCVQLDENACTLVPWLPQRDWTTQFAGHVPIDAVWMVFDRRLKISQNRETTVATLGELLQAGRGATWQRYHDDLKRRLELDSELRAARYRDDTEEAAQITEWIAQYDEVLAADEGPLRAALAREMAELATRPSDEAPERFAALRTLERAFEANDAYRQEIDTTMTWLRARLADQIGLVGYTAAALADMTPIPTHPRAPGVVAHANVLNGLLTGRMPAWAPTWMNAAITVLVGLVATLLSVRWRPGLAAVVVALLMVAYVALAALAFYAWVYWIALVPVVAAPLVSYFAVLLYRYIFLDRERRQLTTALGQYTSATLARKMAEDAELCRRAEMREVSAMFTDLRGFTTISERIGAERTQKVLNLCLGRCSEIMLAHEAMINKFIGDGIFAFWNPVIYPQSDHAERACQTALDLMTGLGALADEQRARGGDEAFGELVLRIGVASGRAVVGPCGSEQKYDYTCIGDTVNVAARLESANKFYGTSMLVSHATHEQAGGGFEFRPLGGVQVKGKQEAVPIYELLGRAGGVSAEQRAYAEGFGRAIAHFQARDWPAAEQAFAACHQQRPDDLAAQRYLDAVRRFSAQLPPENWNGALELAEK